MYYEEKVINGILHARSHPDEEFTPLTPEELASEVISRRKQVEQLKTELEILNQKLPNYHE